MALLGCSGGGGGGDGVTDGGSGTEIAPGATLAPEPPAAGSGVGATGGTGGAGGEVQSPESFAEYYRKLGVAEPVVSCYVEALTGLGVTSLDQLEADQELGAWAIDRFDQCVADAGGAATVTPTT